MNESLTPEQRAIEVIRTYYRENEPLHQEYTPLVKLIATTIRAAEQAQMEQDCLAACMDCRKGRHLDGDTHIWDVGGWGNERRYENRMRCRAANIRAAFTASRLASVTQ